MSVSKLAAHVGDDAPPLDITDNEPEPAVFSDSPQGQRQQQHPHRQHLLNLDQLLPQQHDGGWEPQRVMRKQRYNWHRHLESPGQMREAVGDRLLDDEGDDMAVDQTVFRRPTMETVAQDYFVSSECLAQLRAQVQYQLEMFRHFQPMLSAQQQKQKSIICLRWFPKGSLRLQRKLVAGLCSDLGLQLLDLGRASLSRPSLELQNSVCQAGQSSRVKAVIVFARLKRVLNARAAAEIIFLSTLFRRCSALGNACRVIFVASFESTTAQLVSRTDSRTTISVEHDARSNHSGKPGPNNTSGNDSGAPASSNHTQQAEHTRPPPCPMRRKRRHAAMMSTAAPDSATAGSGPPGKKETVVKAVRGHIQSLLQPSNTTTVKVGFRFNKNQAGLRQRVLQGRLARDAVATRARDHAEYIASALEAAHGVTFTNEHVQSLFRFFLVEPLNQLQLRRSDYAALVDGAAKLVGPRILTAAAATSGPTQECAAAQKTVLDGIRAVCLMGQHNVTTSTSASSPVAPSPGTLADLESVDFNMTKCNAPSNNPRISPASSINSQFGAPSSGPSANFAADQQIIRPEQINVSFDSIGGLVDAKTQVLESIVVPHRCPQLFQGVLADITKGVLLYGPPGTGKTLLAKAIAKEAGATFINVSAAAIHSKWAGDSEKAIAALFSEARRLSPSILFIDEVDSLLRARNGSGGSDGRGQSSGSGSTFERKVVNMFLQEWDGVSSAIDGKARVTVLAATNRPQDLDEAVLRRFEVRCLVDIAGAQENEAILRRTLSEDELQDSGGSDPVDIRRIARICSERGYSASDVVAVCRQAAWVRVREAIGTASSASTEQGTKARKKSRLEASGSSEKRKGADRLAALMALARGSKGGAAATPQDSAPAVMTSQPPLRPICGKDFDVTLAGASKQGSSSAATRAAIREWHARYGSGAKGGNTRRGVFGECDASISQMYS